jgi:hypothetical protein
VASSGATFFAVAADTHPCISKDSRPTFGETESAALDDTAEMIRGYLKIHGGEPEENSPRRS